MRAQVHRCRAAVPSITPLKCPGSLVLREAALVKCRLFSEATLENKASAEAGGTSGIRMTEGTTGPLLNTKKPRPQEIGPSYLGNRYPLRLVPMSLSRRLGDDDSNGRANVSGISSTIPTYFLYSEFKQMIQVSQHFA